MFLLRRTAARAIASAPSAVFVKPRSITTLTPAFRLRQQRWIAPSFQRRFASDEPLKSESSTETTPSTETSTEPEQAAVEASESFAQTVTEAPVEENLTSAQEAAQAEPTDASATVGANTLDAVADQADGARPKRDRKIGGAPAEPSPTIYVGNLYYEVTGDQLKRVFSRFGEVDSVKIIYDNRGLSRGFAYVEYKNVNDAQSAVDNLDMQVFEGRNLVVQFHRAKENSKMRDPVKGGYAANPPSKTLFIGNMSFEMSDKDLNDLFRDIRNVMDVRVAIDRRTGQPRGFAHADFIDVASATRAKEVLGEKIIYGRQLRVDFSKSAAQNDNRGPRRDREQ
ncbi:RNA-binding domain-containing protein [Lentithecium fluviatile CBS 122367]|uniref:RNA-binding domain-containing protein n=1 Tax=Lentithecium fluviatile CBS 122367 TaxID=1168545 RepID=A0A6G1IWC7_9PLEO|nr:RNA-binding domain-containing protein [Lentithecium fluviatile CBS 122367]